MKKPDKNVAVGTGIGLALGLAFPAAIPFMGAAALVGYLATKPKKGSDR